MSVRNYSDIGENGQKIVTLLLRNPTLKKLLVYTDRDPLGHSEVPSDEQVFGTYLKIIPKVGPVETSNSIIVLKFEKFLPNAANAEFKDVRFTIEVFTPMDNWVIKSDNLRPFLIMGEIEKSLQGKTINGLGKIKSLGAELNFLTDEISDYEMNFVLTSYD